MSDPQEQIISDERAFADRLRALDAAATAGPWSYRPDAMDDWGIVKSPRQPVDGFEDGLRCCLAQFRHPEALDEDVLDAHRRAKTDPWQGNAELVTYLRNAVPAILAMAEENARWSEAVATIMARCEALEDESVTALNGALDPHVRGFWSGQKMAAKSLRRELHDLTRALGKDQTNVEG